MDKMKMETPDLAQENFEKLAALFPNCVTERQKSSGGGLERAIDFEKLKQMLADHVREGEEAYEFTWVGKKAAIVEANRPIRRTLRPCVEESKDWDTTQNLYIEGDNLEALKLLQESYLGKVKMIYIDPPYNTGSDFVYPDSYIMDDEEYAERSAYFDEEGNINFKKQNSVYDGRYHSQWCSMIYSRLLVAKSLLAEDGTIFISIDMNEAANLKSICDEIFGSANFISDIIWNSRKSVSNDAIVSTNHNYTLVYARNMLKFNDVKNKFKLPETGEGFENPDHDPRGKWKADPFDSPGIRPNLTYEIMNPNTGEKFLPPSGRCWRTGPNEYKEFLEDNRIVFGKTGKGKPQLKRFLSESESKGVTPKSIWDDCGTATDGTKEIQNIFGGKVFDTPKPTAFLKKILSLATDSDSLVLDFFAGSSSLADAVMQKNQEDGGNRHYILIQLPEKIDSAAAAYKKGFETISDLGKERIRRSGESIKKKDLTTENMDFGFRVLKIDSTNMNDVYYGAEELTQDLLAQTEDNIKSDRTSLDLLFGCLVDWGVPLSLPYTSETIDGCTVHDYADGALIACFDRDVPESVIRAIAKRQPERAVFRDSSFADSPAKINVTEIFKRLSPDTDVRVL